MADVPKIPGLVYQTDEGPGIRRVKSGTGFGYRDPDGNKITDPETRDRIRALAIPPAWTHVWISPDPAGHIQATGRDVRGRKQYRYHPKWSEHRDELKYSNLSNFAEALPSLRKQVEADLARRGLPYERVVASLVWLLENTLIRVGNPAYARDNKSFGLTTL
ncbi:MAG TPA: DNA topoisomerase IB, partial [Tianweitania sediminis]|nr:DNA topoisomerase IB [Tianweitania sediminis]